MCGICCSPLPLPHPSLAGYHLNTLRLTNFDLELKETKPHIKLFYLYYIQFWSHLVHKGNLQVVLLCI